MGSSSDLTVPRVKKEPVYKTNDADLRQAARIYLRDLAPEGVRVVEEMCLDRGTVRVDLALLTAPLLGVELKSDRDTLARLPAQMKHYNAVFGRMVLIVGAKHVEKALALIPEWWTLLIARHDGDGVTLEIARDGRDNPNLSVKAVSDLLWRDETLALLTSRGLDKGWRTKRVAQLRRRLRENVAADVIVSAVSETLAARAGWLPSKA